MKLDNRIWEDIYQARDGIYGALGTIIFGSMTANVVLGDLPFKGWIPSGYEPTVTWRIVGIMAVVMLFLYSFAKLYAHRQVFQNFRSLRQQKCTRGYKGLILLLSIPNPKNFTFPCTKDCFLELNDVRLEGKSLVQDIKALNGAKWNWQQLMRGLEPHIYSLEAVYVIGSKDTEEPDPKTGIMKVNKGSYGDISNAHNIVEKYCTNNPKPLKYGQVVNFENFEELQAAITKGIEELRQVCGIDERDIIIDVTGGQKTTSIAGAVVTLNRDISFQYVQTNYPYGVWEYDLAMRTPVSI